MQGLCPQVQNSLELTRPLRILELGAGCGLLGIGLAATCGAEVVLTDADVDLDEGGTTLDWLEKNVLTNEEVIKSNGGSATIARQVWGDDTDSDAIAQQWPDGFDLVVGSDILYFPEWHPQLLRTLTTFAGSSEEARKYHGREHVGERDPKTSVAVLGYQTRNGAEKRFGQGSGFHVLTCDLPATPAAAALAAKKGRNPTSKTVEHFLIPENQ